MKQNSEDIQIIRDFSALIFKNYPQIENFVNFGLEMERIDKLDKEGKRTTQRFQIEKNFLYLEMKRLD